MPESNVWKIKVTHIKSATEISVRILDSSSSSAFVEMSQAMGQFYSTPSETAVANPAVGKLYACVVYELQSWKWRRVKLLRKNEGNNCPPVKIKFIFTIHVRRAKN